jgi:hypothetical protein
MDEHPCTKCLEVTKFSPLMPEEEETASEEANLQDLGGGGGEGGGGWRLGGRG